MQETFENKKKVDKNKSAIMSDSLYCTISNYINRIDGFFFDKEWLYYNLLFFEKDSNKYFTIWTYTIFTSGINYYNSYSDTSYYNTYFDTINSRKIILIEKKGKDNILFNPTEESLLLAGQEKKKDYLGPIYDGSWYPETYTYTLENGNISIIKSDSLLYQSSVDSNFINFENRFITLKNGHREKRK
jgi:hypothetical protein